jgi:hypothetical protein
MMHKSGVFSFSTPGKPNVTNPQIVNRLQTLSFSAICKSIPSPMDKDQERKRYSPKKDHQPEVTATDLTRIVNGHLDALIEVIKTSDTERLTTFQ